MVRIGNGHVSEMTLLYRLIRDDTVIQTRLYRIVRNDGMHSIVRADPFIQNRVARFV